MGCLNSEGQFEHWFGNIHLSGPCNRSCYFCIGQHMMALDPYNVLDTWPLPGIDQFVEQCLERGVTDVNITGTNTDPMLYKHMPELEAYLRERIPNLVFGLRTNAVKGNYKWWNLFDKGSVTICSTNPIIYRRMMGQGAPPNLKELVRETRDWTDLKVNIVLGPENQDDVYETIKDLVVAGVNKINLREPYGQPYVGNPLEHDPEDGTHLGMPYYNYDGTRVTYWDVHYVEVESVNLYASGRVSTTYPITKGHAPNGEVHDQSNWKKSGRHRLQWRG